MAAISIFILTQSTLTEGFNSKISIYYDNFSLIQIKYALLKVRMAIVE